METQGNAESWKLFLNKEVKVIIEDLPSPIPKSKSGVLNEITDTHIILIRTLIDDGIKIIKPEILRISDIRRVELV
jgi:hypothetical protein